MAYKQEIKYKAKDKTREIKLKLKSDETIAIIWDDEKYIGAGIKLEKDVAIGLAGQILKFYNSGFIYSDDINKNLEKIEQELEDTYEAMVENDFNLDSDYVLELKEDITKLIREISC